MPTPMVIITNYGIRRPTRKYRVRVRNLNSLAESCWFNQISRLVPFLRRLPFHLTTFWKAIVARRRRFV